MLSSHINEYVKNCLQSKPENLDLLERELKKELLKSPQQDDDLLNLLPEANVGGQNELPVDLLLNERINAKLLQVKLKRVGVVLSMWEVFSIFDHLNT